MDDGDNNEHIAVWHQLDGGIQDVSPWLVEPTRPMGCQFVNTHNVAISEVFNCNTNVTIGGPDCVYYTTVYGTKDTQKDDSEHVQNIANASNKRLLRVEQELIDGTRRPEDVPQGFTAGLCTLLVALNASTSRYKVSTVMMHRIVCNGGTRFNFSHGFIDLLISQLEAVLENRPVRVRIRTNLLNGKPKLWTDSSADDYLFRPEELDDWCTYEMAMWFKKAYKSFKQMKGTCAGVCNAGTGNTENNNEEDNDSDSVADTGNTDNNKKRNSKLQQDGQEKYAFIGKHPGKHFCHLTKLVLHVIPKISHPKGKLCNIELLKIKSDNPDEDTIAYRENYAKIALLMFYPFRKIDDLKLEGSFWTLFETQRSMNFDKDNSKEGKFWPRGFEILQNIQDRKALEKGLRRARDIETQKTTCRDPDDANKKRKRKDNTDQSPDITAFCSFDE